MFTRNQAPKKRSRVNQRRTLSYEPLEPKVVLSGVSLVDGDLVISGSPGADTAVISQQDGRVFADVNGELQFFPGSGVKAIEFWGGDGNDTFENKTGIATVAVGGAGSDTLIGGGGRDW